MGYQIEVQAGKAAGDRGQLKAGVCRVGSVRSLELPVPELSPHALTVFQRGKRILVLNRSPTNVAIGKVKVPIGATSDWPLGQTLSVQGVGFRVLVENNHAGSYEESSQQRTSRRKRTKKTQQNRNVGKSASRSPGMKGNRIQLLTIIGSLGMILIMQLGAGSSDAANQQRRNQITFATTKLRSAIATEDTNPNVRLRLERLLNLVSQVRVADAMDDQEEAQAMREETAQLCRSILLNPGSASEESALINLLIRTL